LQGEVTNKLAASYLEGGKPAKAAVEFERLAQSNKDPIQRRAALWQAAELYEQAGSEKQAVSAYERYIKQYPSPLEPAMEGRHRVATINKKQRNGKRYYHWLSQIVVAEQKARKESTARTRTLAAHATMELAEPVYRQYRQVKLVRPLKKSLKTKKKKMELTLKAYDRAVEYGVAEVTTAATYRLGEIYNDFGRALLKSQRPKGLSAEELEQYDVLLEEQAYPFEEKAIEIHETNAGRISKGIYDQWVKKSFAALGKLMPARYAKYEKSEVVINAIR
jgi:tetratricopeptide (TPR) repeat protein